MNGILHIAGLDYQAGSGSIQVSSGGGASMHSVTILSDDLAEGSEFFGLTLSNPSVQLSDGSSVTLSAQESSRVILNPTSATVNIEDPDGK